MFWTICLVLYYTACPNQSILQDILTQLVPEVQAMGDGQMVQLLHQVQKETKCLVVLDDIWKVDDWESLVAAFPTAEGESKILLTTRDRKVAEIGFPYAPKFLTKKESWELLQRIAFSSQNVKDVLIESELKDVGIEMAGKCGGLPFAISVLGGILRGKNSLTEWQMVNKYVGLYLSKVEDDGGVVARVLSLSYTELPTHLRLCFLYLASFKEDEMIHVGHLYQLWMAEGLVLSQHQRCDETLIDVAERYLDELARRSMVQVRLEECQIFEKYNKECSLHDMMRNLCIEKAREEEFIEVVDYEYGRQPLLGPSLPNNLPCRLAFYMDDDEVVKGAAKGSNSEQENNQQLRSLLCLSRVKTKEISWPQGVVNLENNKSLRALVLEGFDFHKKLPVDIRKMIHLRYLKLQYCKLDELPSSIAELPFLQTLYIHVNGRIKVPNVLHKMKQLRHLYILRFGSYTETGKLRLNGLTELEIFVELDSSRDEVSDLPNLLNLRFLSGRIYDKDSLEILIDHINMNGLKLKEVCLVIQRFDLAGTDKDSVLLRKVLMSNLRCLSSFVGIRKFPIYEPEMLKNLAYLRLEESYIEEDPMKTLEMLPQLQILKLGTNAYIGKDMVCHEYGFPKLRDLTLFQLPNLELWCIDRGAMPNMFSLVIYGCPELKMIPDGLKFVLSLQRLSLWKMSAEFYDRIQDIDGKEGDDYYKIQHVSILFWERKLQMETSRRMRTRGQSWGADPEDFLIFEMYRLMDFHYNYI